MPTLLDFRRRIRSVKNTQQITRAMKFIAAARLRRAQETAVSLRPYASGLREILRSAMSRIEDPEQFPLLTQRPEERVLVLVTAGERGLCGAFNANVLRRAFDFLREKSGASVEVIAIAKKSRDAFRKRSWKIAGEYVDVTSRADLAKAKEIAAEVMKIYQAGGADSVYLIYNEFKNVMMQTLRVEKLLPLDRSALGGHDKGAPPASADGTVDYIYEQPAAEIFSKLGLTTVNLDMFSREVGEKLAGRTGGAVSLAVGMAQIFRGLPGMDRLMGYWYHYAIMFEALFILTTVDTGTRVARYVLQELMGKVHKPFGNSAWLPGNLVTSSLVVLGWGYLIYTGNISTIWPLFGTGNQLLATIALAVSTTFLINMGKARYAWITAAPMCFVGATTITAGVLSIKNIFWPLTSKPGQVFTGYLDSTLMVIFVTGVVLVLLDSVRRWYKVLNGAPAPQEAFGPPLTAAGEVKMGCC